MGALLALAGFVILMAGPIGYRLGLLSLPVAINRVFVWGANLAGIGLILSAAGLVATWRRPYGTRRGVGRAVLAIAVAGDRGARRRPNPLHDDGAPATQRHHD